MGLRFFMLSCVVVALVIAGGLAFFVAESRAPHGIPKEGILVQIKPGSGASEVSRALVERGVLRSQFVFKAYSRFMGKEALLKSGVYRVEQGMGVREIVDLLASGKQALIKTTIPEGYTVSQTAKLLEAVGVQNSEAFLKASRDPELLSSLGVPASSFEGYLFPDTYFFPADYPAADIIRTMMTALKKRLSESIPESSAMTAVELHEKVILASIVEREYRLPEEAPLMASVFYNRLRIGMALQSCATVVYVLTEKEGNPHPEVIYDRDLKIADPYNTYQHRGLPPGPISSPGITALQAVFRPQATSYLYFRLIDAQVGKHHFSTSLEEHNEAAALIVKRVGG